MNERRIAYLKEEIADQEKIAFWRGERQAENYIRKLKCELSQLEAENEVNITDGEGVLLYRRP